MEDDNQIFDRLIEIEQKSREGIGGIIELLSDFEQQNQDCMEECLVLANEISNLISNSENKPKYQLNLLDEIGVNEPMTSRIISIILKYRNKNNHVLCRSFIEHFLVPYGFDIKWFSTPEISAERDNIDICIQEKGKYAVIIENKLKGAVFQRNQLARYIAKMRKAGYSDDRIFIVILPNTVDRGFCNGIRKSVWRLPEDWEKPNQERRCADFDDVCCKCDVPEDFYDEKICRGCDKKLKEIFSVRNITLSINFLAWLKDDCLNFNLVPEEEYVLRSAIVQFADFLDGIYNNRLNDKLLKEMEDFLREKLLKQGESKQEQWKKLEKTKKNADELTKGLESLMKEFKKECIEDWKRKLSDNWKVQSDAESFWIDIDGVKCGCWNGDCPYWGFKCDSPTSEQKEMVDKIISELKKIETKKEEKGWIAWNYTFHGDERCEAFYQAAKDLGYLK